MGKDAGRVLGGDPKLARGGGEIASDLIQAGQLRGRGCLVAVPPLQRPRQRDRQGYSATRRNLAVQRLLVQNMDEPVAACQRSIRKLLFIEQADQPVDAVEHLQSLFDVRRIQFQSSGHHRRIELVSLNAGRTYQATIGVAEPIQLALDHAAHRSGQVVAQAPRPLRDRPASARLGNYAAIAQVAQQIGDEKRAALGPLINAVGEIGGKRVTGEHQRQVLIDFALARGTQSAGRCKHPCRPAPA